MKHFLRPYRKLGILVLMGLGGLAGARAQSTQVADLLEGTNPLLGHATAQGYLGVWVDDVDAEKAQTLKLKEVRGAVVTIIDHDAPAGKMGLRVNDVVLQLNGENVEGAEQLRRMLKEIPPGRKVSMEFSRDGNVQTTSVELADRRAMEHEIWKKIGNDGDVFAQTPGMGVLSGNGGDAALPGMFHMPIFGSTLNVGAMVEPLTGQMAEYLGVVSGLMVKQVAHKSEAASAGFKPFDVILRVGPDAVTTLSDWDRALRANQGKPVQVTILRDKKQQTLTLQVDSKHKTSSLDFQEIYPGSNSQLVAELEIPEQQLFAAQGQAAETLRDQAEKMKDAFPEGLEQNTDPLPAEELRKEAEQLRDSMQDFKGQDFTGLDFKGQDFKVDPKMMDEMKQQMDQFRQDFKGLDSMGQDFTGLDFKGQDFKVDPKVMDEMKQQMEQFRQDFKGQDFTGQDFTGQDFTGLDFKGQDFKVDPKVMEEMKQQMEQFRKDFKGLALDAHSFDMHDFDIDGQAFKFDSKQMDDLKKSMDEFRKGFAAGGAENGPF